MTEKESRNNLIRRGIKKGIGGKLAQRGGPAQKKEKEGIPFRQGGFGLPSSYIRSPRYGRRPDSAALALAGPSH
jgi:hypothetical protein